MTTRTQFTVPQVEAITRAGGILKGNIVSKQIADTTPGLFLRVWKPGRSTWAVRYQLKGKRRWVPLGDAVGKKAISLAQARAEATSVMAAAGNGRDPWLDRKEGLAKQRQAAADKKAADKAASLRITVAEAVERYIAYSDREAAKRKKGPNRERNRILEREVVPALGRIKLDDLTDDHIMTLVQRAVDKVSEHKGKKIHGEVRTFLNWAVKRTRPRLLHRSPLISEGPDYDGERDRVLTVQEVRTFLSKLSQTPMTQPLRDVLELQLRLGQRVGEALKMRRVNIKLDEDAWVIPGKVAKNGEPTRVPLPPKAKAIIARALADPENTTEWLFPAKDGEPYETWIASKAMARAQGTFGLLDADGEPLRDAEGEALTITSHDLRRTAATFLERIDTPMDVIKLILNHTSEKQITNRYARADRFEVAFDALLRWEVTLDRIMAGEDPFAVTTEDRAARAERIRAEMLGAAQ